MKTRLSFFTLLFISTNMLFAQTSPLWFTERTFEFPEKEYVSAIGSGETEQEAKNNALASLSVYFGVKVNVKKSSGFSTAETNSDFTKTKNSSSQTDISAENELPAVQFTEIFQTDSRYYVCAYIRRSSAVSELSARAENALSKANFSLLQAENASNDMLAFKNAKEAKILCADAEKNVRMISVLDFEKSRELLKKQGETTIRAEKIIADSKKCLVFSVQTDGDDGSAETCVKEIISSEGFSLSPNGKYKMSVKVAFQESANSVGIFVKPSVEISLFDSEKNVVGSYSKSLPKFGHRTLEAAYSKARVEIVKDLRENLAREIFE